MYNQWIRGVFIIAGIYDGMLGMAFLIMPEAIFAFYQVTPPNHMAYVEFPAFLLVLFAIMFFRIAMDPARFRELMLYGVGLKVAYCSLVFKYVMTTVCRPCGFPGPGWTSPSWLSSCWPGIEPENWPLPAELPLYG